MTESAQTDEFVTALLTASRVLIGLSARSLRDIEDTVTLPQFRTLVVLGRSAETNLTRLAEVLEVTPSTALRSVDKLLALGLVRREENATNRREVVLGLSEAGRELVGRVTRRRRTELGKVVRRMPAGSRDGLLAALAAFNDAAGEPPAHGVGW